MTRFLPIALITLLLAAGTNAHAANSTVTCDTSTTLTTVNTCVPELKLYISGSSALSNAIKTVVISDLFDTSTMPVTTIIDNGSSNGNVTNGAKSVTAWYGLSKQNYGNHLFVVYNNKNGSGSGLTQLLTKPEFIPEADVVKIGPLSANLQNNCIVDPTSTYAAPVISCTSHAPTPTDLVVSDVNAIELFALETPTSGNLATSTKLTKTPLAMEGLGVAVNKNLYSALQLANISDGLLPASCAGSDSSTCQPTIRSADYASLISKTGIIKSSAALLNNSDTTPLTLARGSDLLGIQAASNIFFALNPCHSAVNTKGKAIKGVLGGELDILTSKDLLLSPNLLAVKDYVTSDEIVSSLNAVNDYVIGVLGLTTVPSASDSWKFVKLNGISPNFNDDGSIDPYQRNAFIRGKYPFAMTFYAINPTKTPAKGLAVHFSNVISALENGLKDSQLHNLTGIGYLDGVDNFKQSLYSHTNGNNCSPLIRNSSHTPLPPLPVTITGVSDGNIYTAPVTPSWIDADGTSSIATLDGYAYINGAVISASGSHTLVVTTTKKSNGLTSQISINFTIDTLSPLSPIVTGVTDGEIYNTSVSATWTDALGTTSNASLDGSAYINGTSISTDGVHTLVILTTKKLNGISTKTSISFTINTLAPQTLSLTAIPDFTSIQFFVAINKIGSGYYLVQQTAIPAPTLAQVLVGQQFTMTANNTSSLVKSGLTPSTSYTIYFIAKDSANNYQAKYQSLEATTIALPLGYISEGGLTWMPISPPANTWAGADNYCKNNTSQGAVWRMPKDYELIELYQSHVLVGNSLWLLGATWSATEYSTGNHIYISIASSLPSYQADHALDTKTLLVSCVH
jgi:hypothetical protein